MGGMSVFGACWACNRIFAFNPERVPCFPVEGVREPICADCMAAANEARVANGLEPWVILPGAYEPPEAL